MWPKLPVFRLLTFVFKWHFSNYHNFDFWHAESTISDMASGAKKIEYLSPMESYRVLKFESGPMPPRFTVLPLLKTPSILHFKCPHSWINAKIDVATASRPPSIHNGLRRTWRRASCNLSADMAQYPLKFCKVRFM